MSGLLPYWFKSKLRIRMRAPPSPKAFIFVMAELHVRVGQWIKTKPVLSGVCYLTPPSQKRRTTWRRIAVFSYCGPVHAVERSKNFIAVQVPHPDDPETLVWVNVVAWQARGDQRNYSAGYWQWYCIKIDPIAEGWLRRGWENNYLRDPIVPIGGYQ